MAAGESMTFQHETHGAGVVSVGFNLLEVFEKGMGLSLKDERVKDRLKQARGDVTTHFNHYPCPKSEKKELKPGPGGDATPQPSGTGSSPQPTPQPGGSGSSPQPTPGTGAAGGSTEGNSASEHGTEKPPRPSLEEVLSVDTDQCWKWRFTSAGVSGLLAEWEYFRAKVRVAGRYDGLAGGAFLKAETDVQVALYYVVQAFLGDVDVNWDASRGVWTAKKSEGREHEVAVSPRCRASASTDDRPPISAESCGYDTVSGIVTVVASFKRIVDVNLGIQFDADGVVTDVSAQVDAAVTSVQARAYGQRINFLHTPFLSYPLSSTNV